MIKHRTTGCPCLNKLGVIGTYLGTTITTDSRIKIKSQKVIDYCLKCPEEICYLDTSRVGRPKRDDSGRYSKSEITDSELINNIKMMTVKNISQRKIATLLGVSRWQVKRILLIIGGKK